MDQIHRKHVEVNGLKLHVAEIGTGPTAVMFLHGFPEIWYSWRHQMIALADAGYRAIAPDYRGYGLSDPPPEPEKTSLFDFIDDLVALLDALDIPKVFLVAKDFGSRIAYLIALMYPKRISGVVTMGLPFRPIHASTHLKGLPEGFYISRWRSFGTSTYYSPKNEIPIAGEDKEIMDMVEPSTPLPPWLTDEDMEIYGALYENSGFQTALQVPYRSMPKHLDIPDPKVEVPAMLIMGEEDYVFKFPGMKEYISGEVKTYVPNLETIYVPEGTHFVQEQFPDQVNQLLLTFLSSHS